MVKDWTKGVLGIRDSSSREVLQVQGGERRKRKGRRKRKKRRMTTTIAHGYD